MNAIADKSIGGRFCVVVFVNLVITVLSCVDLVARTIQENYTNYVNASIPKDQPKICLFMIFISIKVASNTLSRTIPLLD